MRKVTFTMMHVGLKCARFPVTNPCGTDVSLGVLSALVCPSFLTFPFVVFAGWLFVLRCCCCCCSDQPACQRPSDAVQCVAVPKFRQPQLLAEHKKGSGDLSNFVVVEAR